MRHSPRGADTARTPRGENVVKLIGGTWRGKKIHFPDSEGLRPTPSRVRETLFNWLMNDARDARVLDLYAGSGAIAFEALSRGAREAVLVDSSAAVCSQLSTELAALKGANGRIVRADAAQFTAKQAEAPFDIVFLDPPFHRDLLPAQCRALEANGYLRDGTLVYIESEGIPSAVDIPANWRTHRQQQAGQVVYSLFVREPRT